MQAICANRYLIGSAERLELGVTNTGTGLGPELEEQSEKISELNERIRFQEGEIIAKNEKIESQDQKIREQRKEISDLKDANSDLNDDIFERVWESRGQDNWRNDG